VNEHYGIRGIVLLWFPIVGPIAAWAVHIVGEAALTRYTCNASGTDWTVDALTAATLLVAALGTWLAWRLMRVSAAEDAPDVAGRHLFIGRLGVLVGVTNLLVIALEHVYFVGLHSVRCA
jgi:hypothetical protein